ncbi:MAG: DinB family protein [Rhodothermales bacterium]
MKLTPIIDALASQYEAALEMLRAAIQATPVEVWDSADYENRTWRLAYHVLYGTKMYLASSPETFLVWEGVIEGAESLGGPWEDPSATVVLEDVHSVDELVAFLESLLAELPEAIAALPLEADSGFEWYPFSRLELHLNSIRHIQHHTAQIIERLRSHGVTGIEWVSGAGAVEW